MEVVGLILLYISVKIQQVKFGINIKSHLIILLRCDLGKMYNFFSKSTFFNHLARVVTLFASFDV